MRDIFIKNPVYAITDLTAEDITNMTLAFYSKPENRYSDSAKLLFPPFNHVILENCSAKIERIKAKVPFKNYLGGSLKGYGKVVLTSNSEKAYYVKTSDLLDIINQ